MNSVLTIGEKPRSIGESKGYTYDLSALGDGSLPVVRNGDIRMLVDSGAQQSFVSELCVSKLGLRTSKLGSIANVRTASGELIPLTRQAKIEDFGEVMVAPLGNGFDVILGFPWMKSVKARFDYDRDELVYGLGSQKKRLPLEMGERSMMSKKELNRGLKTGDIHSVWVVELVGPKVESERAQEVLMSELSVEMRSMTMTELPEKMKQILKDYPEVFPEKPKLVGAPRPRLRLSQPAMKIHTGDAEPIKLPYYKLGPADQDELKKQLGELLDAKLIQPSISPWGAPVLFVTKKDGSKRLCVDYRALNRVTKADAYPLPRIQESLDRLGNSRVYTSMDATSGFWQNPVAEEDIPKTAFNTRYGSFEFKVTPFGLKNCPSAFQRMMDEIFREYLDKFVIIYIDDILIYSKSMKEHLEHVRLVAAKLRDYGIQINMNKSRFAVDHVNYCGYVVKEGKISIDPLKIHAVKEWPVPKNISDVRSFLGFIGYYRRLIKDYGTLTAPLHNATAKEGFKWTEIEQRSFEQLKDAMIAAPVLRCPDDALIFHIWPDASPWAVGGVLTQDDGSGHQPIAYEYHKLAKAELNYPHHEKEILAMLHCLRKWRYYFEGRKVVVHSDSNTVVRMSTVKDPHRRLQRWINEYQYWSPDIVYEPGKTNPADALSRLTFSGEGEEIKKPISEEDVFGLYTVTMDEYVKGTFNRAEDWPLLIAYYLEKGKWPDESDELINRCKPRVKEFEIYMAYFALNEKERVVYPTCHSKTEKRL